jgi:beta-xylosidase
LGEVLQARCGFYIEGSEMKYIIALLTFLLTFIASAQPTTKPIVEITPLFDVQIRDTSICLAGDGMYYLTGTTGANIWVSNEGIELWRSADLKSWEHLGFVWKIEENGTWQKQWTKKKDKDGKEFDRRSIWAPEIHYIKGNFYIAYCVTGLGTGILKSGSGKPEGPYVSTVVPDAPLTKGIDASLFADDDGKAWFAWGSGYYAPLKDDLSALAGEARQVHCTPPDLDEYRHHGDKYCPDKTHVGFEGAFLFKANGKYRMACAERWEGDGRYTCMISEADSLDGPWGPRYEAVACGGHNTFFQDKSGKWYATLFGNDKLINIHEKPALVPVDFDQNGHFFVPKWK